MKPSIKGMVSLALVGSVGLCASAMAAAPKTPGSGMKLPEIKYETYTLPNGLKVITHEDHRLPLVAVDLWYHVGPLNEKAGRTGFAHLFEHMMFEGSEHVGEKAHIKIVQGAGATDVNGTTSFDRTNYFETMPSNQLELALWLESDRMGFLMEGLDRVKLTNQRDVVRNERRQGEGAPYSGAREKTFQLLFPEGHPYRANVIGSHADIEAARIADIRDFHQQYYTPNNASIAIAGDFDAKQLKELLTKYFGPIPAGPKVDPVHVVTPPITEQKRATVTDTVKLSQVTISWLTPAIFTPGANDMSVAMYALGGAKASRLDRALVFKAQIAQSVTCYSYPLQAAGMTQCQLTAKPGVKPEDLEKTFWEELARLQNDGPSAQEVEAAKAMNLTGKISGLERLGGFGGIADTLDMYNQYTGDPGFLPKDVAAMQAVTPASAKATVDKYLTKNSAVVVYCVPGEKKLQDVPRSPDDTDAAVKIVNPYSQAFETAQNWRKTVPVAAASRPFRLPTPKTWTLANGLKVYFVEEHSLPLLAASVGVRAGSENNGAADAGLATLTADVLGEATTTLDMTTLADKQELLGLQIGTYAWMDGATASLSTLTAHTSEAMHLLADVVEHPAFADSDFDRVKKQRLVSLQQEGDNVSAIAYRVAPELLFGGQPYGFSSNGTKSSVEQLTRGDVTKFYAAHYGPADSALVLVGDLTEAEAHALAEKNFGAWSGTAAGAPSIPAPPVVGATHVVLVDKAGAPQSSLNMTALGVPVSSPDMPILSVMNYTLGGSFASRINMNLREEHGYTYGSRSGFGAYREGGSFSSSALVRTNVTGDAAKQMMLELKRFPENPSTDAELKMAKDASIRSLPGQFETAGATAGALQSIFLYDRPLDYYATLPQKYEAVTSADVARVSKQYLHPDNMIILVVGDLKTVQPQMKDANLGPIEVRDTQGNPVTKDGQIGTNSSFWGGDTVYP